MWICGIVLGLYFFLYPGFTRAQFAIRARPVIPGPGIIMIPSGINLAPTNFTIDRGRIDLIGTLPKPGPDLTVIIHCANGSSTDCVPQGSETPHPHPSVECEEGSTDPNCPNQQLLEISLPELLKMTVDEFNKLALQEIAFNFPEQLKVGRKEKIGVTITKGFEDDLSRNIRNQLSAYRYQNINIRPELEPPALIADDFAIKPLGSMIRNENGAESTLWEFEVVPLKAGTSQLNLTIAVKMGTAAALTTHSSPKITIKPNLLYKLGKFCENNWGWVTVIVIFSGLVGWNLKGFNKSREN